MFTCNLRCTGSALPDDLLLHLLLISFNPFAPQGDEIVYNMAYFKRLFIKEPNDCTLTNSSESPQDRDEGVLDAPFHQM
jgi:hypothetical protein